MAAFMAADDAWRHSSWPAKVGIHAFMVTRSEKPWMPTFVSMTRSAAAEPPAAYFIACGVKRGGMLRPP
jgi:hypothetical protein